MSGIKILSKFNVYLLCLFLNIYISGCEYASNSLNHNSPKDSLYGGEEVNLKKENLQSVVYIQSIKSRQNVVIDKISYVQEEIGTCTGTLIFRDIVITAAHCIVDFDESGKAQDPIEVKIGFGAKTENMSEYISATAWAYHSDFSLSTLKNDIAVINIRNDLPEGFAPISVGHIREKINQVLKLDVFGYGQTNGVKKINPDSTLGAGVLRHATREVDVSKSLQPDGRFLIPSNNNVGSCQGDSGGPAFLNTNGSLQILGVLSGHNFNLPQGMDKSSHSDVHNFDPNWDTCKPGNQKYSIYTDLSSYTNWIAQAIADIRK